MPSKLTELKRLGAGSSLYLLADVFVMTMGLLTLPVLTRYMSPEEYGILAMCAVVVGVLTPLFTLGQFGSIQRYFFDYSPGEFRAFLSTAVQITLLAGVVVISLALLFGDPLFDLLAPGVPVHPFLVMALLTGFLVTFFQMYLRLQQIQERPARYTVLRMANAGTGAALAITLVVVMEGKVLAALLANLIVAGVFFVGLLIPVRARMAPRFDTGMARQSLRYGLPVVPHLLSGFIIGQIGRVFLANQVSLSSVGVFSVGFVLYQVIETIARAVNQAWKPMFFRTTRDNQEKAPEFLGEMTTYYWLFNWLAAFSIAMLGPEILAVLAGEEFQEARTLVIPLVAAGILQTFYFRFITSNMWAKRPEFTTLATFLAAGASLLANALLVPRFGMMGAAYAVVVANATAAVVVFFTGQYSFYVKYEWVRVAKLLLAFSLVLAVGSVLDPGLGYLGRVGLKLLLILAIPPALLLLGFFKEEEIAYLGRFLRRAKGGGR